MTKPDVVITQETQVETLICRTDKGTTVTGMVLPGSREATSEHLSGGLEQEVTASHHQWTFTGYRHQEGAFRVADVLNALTRNQEDYQGFGAVVAMGTTGPSASEQVPAATLFVACNTYQGLTDNEIDVTATQLAVATNKALEELQSPLRLPLRT